MTARFNIHNKVFVLNIIKLTNIFYFKFFRKKNKIQTIVAIDNQSRNQNYIHYIRKKQKKNNNNNQPKIILNNLYLKKKT